MLFIEVNVMNVYCRHTLIITLILKCFENNLSLLAFTASRTTCDAIISALKARHFLLPFVLEPLTS